jgi:hypothetical protein
MTVETTHQEVFAELGVHLRRPYNRDMLPPLRRLFNLEERKDTGTGNFRTLYNPALFNGERTRLRWPIFALSLNV